MTDNSKGLVFNIQKFSLQDGPGIRTTIFMKGCPLSCKWCSNPESINPYPEIMTYDMKCIKCGKCIEACPVAAISMVDGMRRIDREKCNLCLECAKVCPSGAIEQTGTYMTVEEVVTEIEKDNLFYANSGGGVTFSGGEPLLQADFVAEVLKRCKQKGIHTALDTTGYARWEAIEKLIKYVDLFLYDLKHMDRSLHKQNTGVGNRLILDNLIRLQGKAKIWLRIPVVPDYNDSVANIEKTAELASGLKVDKVSLLPYHGWGEQKYERLGRDYLLKDKKPPSSQYMQQLKEVLESHGLEVTISS